MEEEISELKRKLEEHEKRISALEGFWSQAKPKPSEKKISIKEFILQKKPKNDTQKALAIGYYLENFERFTSFNTRDVEKGFRDAREKVPPNVSDKIQMNISKDHMMDAGEEKDDLKAYVLTNSGERFVENNFTEKGELVWKKPKRL